MKFPPCFAKRIDRTGNSAAPLHMIFFCNGALFANWFPRIPEMVERLGLAPGELGLVLLGIAGGALCSMPVAGRLALKIRPNRLIAISAPLYCGGLPLVTLTETSIELFAVLFFLGATNGVLDIAMNAEAANQEQQTGRRLMARLHGAFSVGMIVGAVTATVAVGALSLEEHFVVASVLLTICSLLAIDRLAKGERMSDITRLAPPAQNPHDARRRDLLILGAVGFAALMCEGVVADWGAIFVRDVYEAGERAAASAYACFVVCLAAGRLSGNHLENYLGPRQLFRGGGLLIILAFSQTVLIATPVAALLGFAMIGLGLACVFPLVLRAAAHYAPKAPAPLIAFVSTIAYPGFLAAPPLIGFAAELVGLQVAMAVLPLIGILIVFSADFINFGG